MRNYRMSANAECACGHMPETSLRMDRYALAMAYVPWQAFRNVYEPDKALEIGTIFPELNKPFLAEGRNYRK